MVSVSPSSRQRPVSTSSSSWPLTQERNWAAKAPPAPIWAIHIAALSSGWPVPNHEPIKKGAANRTCFKSDALAFKFFRQCFFVAGRVGELRVQRQSLAIKLQGRRLVAILLQHVGQIRHRFELAGIEG